MDPIEENLAESLILSAKEGREKKAEPPEVRDIYFTVDHEPLYTTLDLELTPKKSILVDASTVVAMDPSVTLMTKLRGGLLQNLAKILGREVIVLNQFSADSQAGHLRLAPPLPGDIHHYHLSDKKGLYLHSSHFLACKPTVQINTHFTGMQDFYNDDSTALLHFTGQGDLWFSSCGGLLDVAVDETITFNPDYVLAFEDSLDYEVEVCEGLCADHLKENLFGGKGRLCRLRGEGQVWLQSRQDHSFLNYLKSFLPSVRTIEAP
ncbi:TIGR00266 family protein [Synechocystis sp. LKSZ1]|uniref:TIGR00266 family protein n=1 Tax=Synechocystis sp. LKSZ1 TaxID=3144951 RepID=UPI00336BB289